MAITATGIGSGLDIESLVSQLVAAERAPFEARLFRRNASLTAELSGFGSLKGALAGFQNTLAGLNALTAFGQRTAKSADDAIATISAGVQAAASSYDLTVSQLAKSHSLASGAFTSAADIVGTGTLTIRFGNTDYTPPDPGPEGYSAFTVNPERGTATISIDASNNTLEGVRDAINNSDIGVSASIVNDGSGFRLLLSSEQTGAENSLEITVNDTGDGNDLDGSGLSTLAFNSSATNLSQTVSAQDAVFTINGLTISSSDNTANNVINGVDITLKNVSDGAPILLTIAEDRAGLKKAITAFVEGYNNFVKTINGLTSFDAQTSSSGPLQGDFSARSITSQLRQVLSNAVQTFGGPLSSLGQIGLTTKVDGTLIIDSDDLDSALENHFDKFVGLFAAVGLPSDSDIDYISASDATQVASHAINISQLATRGQLFATAVSFPLVVDADNDNFSITVDGIFGETISLTQGNYASGEALAAELQSRINGDATLGAAGVSVAVVFNVDHFEITSERYGSGSTVEITAVDTNSTAQLGFSIATGVNGIDVVGTIGGVAATGRGQILKGGEGSDAEGLQLIVSGGVIGDRGAVDFSRGIAHQINVLITSFLGEDGILETRTDGIQSRVDDIEDRQEVLNRRIDAFEARIRTQFNALDGLLAQLQTTSSFLTQQLASLPKAGLLLRNN